MTSYSFNIAYIKLIWQKETLENQIENQLLHFFEQNMITLSHGNSREYF